MQEEQKVANIEDIEGIGPVNVEGEALASPSRSADERRSGRAQAQVTGR